MISSYSEHSLVIKFNLFRYIDDNGLTINILPSTEVKPQCCHLMYMCRWTEYPVKVSSGPCAWTQGLIPSSYARTKKGPTSHLVWLWWDFAQTNYIGRVSV
uniref:Uncharacterized protein n=1 Tax=Cacopsylla melanoneura TaxID=428564 RepID=A0A8D8TVX7_9HEMI